MNRPTYVPKMPNQPDLDLIFDTSFLDIQPYLFKVLIYVLWETQSIAAILVQWLSVYSYNL